MCNVCVAENALAMTNCKKNTCAAFQRGYEIRWDEGPDLTLAQFDPKGEVRRKKWRTRMRPIPKKKRGKLANHCNRNKPMIFVRARGKGAEFKAAQYQLRLPYDQWPKKWVSSKDLAGSMSLYGLDVKWDCIPKAVKDALLRKGPLPSDGELRAAQAKRRKAREKKFGKKKQTKPEVRIPVKVKGRWESKPATKKELAAWKKGQVKKFKKWKRSAEAKRRQARYRQDLNQQRAAWRP